MQPDHIYLGDSRHVLAGFDDNTVNCAITSPPYWGLRDYGTKSQIGSEPSIDDYVAALVDVFAQVRRVLVHDGVCWLNLGDGYTSGGRRSNNADPRSNSKGMPNRPNTPDGLKPKDLLGVPWRAAFALQADGWYLRSEIIWNKPNAHPESVTDRVTQSHETIFMLTKSERYFFDVNAIKEPAVGGGLRRRRSVWTVPTSPTTSGHPAVFPAKLIEPMILASAKPDGVVLDPFFGSGTTGEVARRLGRRFVGVELSAAYANIAAHRLGVDVVDRFQDTGQEASVSAPQPLNGGRE